MYGVSYNGVNVSSIPPPVTNHHQLIKLPRNSIVLSTSESSSIQSSLRVRNKLMYAAGAGYKLTCVADQLVGGYLLSKGTTFKWDTCGPHALLKSIGGNIVNFSKAQEFVSANCDLSLDLLIDGIKEFEILYEKPNCTSATDGERWSNSSGILGYLEPEVAVQILKSTIEVT